MADVSYSKSVAAEPAVAEAATRSPRRWMPSRERWLGIATIVAFIAIWEIVYRLGLMPKWAFPSPWKVVLAFQELIANGKLLTNTAASVGRQITGVLLAALVGIPAGLALGASPTARAAFLPLCRLLYPIPGIAWIPLAILWFGVGDVSPIFLIFISSVFPMIVQTTSGVHTIERRYLRAAANFGVSRSVLFRRVVIPAVLPEIIVGMRIGVGVAWLVVVAAEMIALRSGLGYLIMDSRNAGNRYDLVIASMIIIGVIGLLLDGITRLLERLKTVKWRYVR